MKTELPNARAFPRFAGLCSFFRLPIQTEAKKGVDWAIYGVPYDNATSYRPGARFGPRGIREQSAYIKPYHLEYQEHLLERFSLVDAGDCPVKTFSTLENLKAHEEFALNWRKLGAKTFAVGGDHSIALGNIRATSKALNEKLALIHFDSHTDTVDELWDEAYSHASPIRRAIEEGLVEKASIISVGVKGPVNTSEELKWGQENGIEYLTYDDWRRSGSSRLEAFVKKIKNKSCYITFDIDCIDPVFAPGTGTPSVGGFTSSEAIDLVRKLKGIKLEGADMVEVAPSLDPTYVTSLLAAHLIYEILSL